MRCGRRLLAVSALLLAGAASPRAAPLHGVHQQRYCMGTMVDIVAYHPLRADAEAAVARALDECVRLDQVMSHYRQDSGLSALLRDGRRHFTRVDPALYEIVRESLVFSRLSAGRFDITVGPLVRAWRNAGIEGRPAPAASLADARACVGFELIEMRPPDQIRLQSDCAELDLGAIGKGYAVDRAIEILRAADIRHAMVNAGGSSIAAVGTSPGGNGWPVLLGGRAGARVLILRDASVSTSQQQLAPLSSDKAAAGEIVDPRTGAPVSRPGAVIVVAPRATIGDGLDTTLLLMSISEGSDLLSHFPGAAAFWVSDDGRIEKTVGGSSLEISDAR
jgi:thiamine biosynthesis lipoprotein